MDQAHAGGTGHEGAPGSAHAHGPAEIPPEPAARSISPAPEEFALPFPGRGLLWPLVWLGVGLAFLAAATRWYGQVERPGAHGGREAPARSEGHDR